MTDHSTLPRAVVEGALEPLPCPFCGHTGLDFADGSTYRWGIASCSNCGATSGEIRREYPDKGEWHKEAIEEWNRRAPLAEPVQEPAPMPLFPPVSQWKLGCAVCGIGGDGKAYGYVCPRSDCPTKVTCGGAE